MLRVFYLIDTFRQRFVAIIFLTQATQEVGLGTSKGIYVGGTLLSILLSLYLFTSGRRETGIFVGLWAPTVLNLGQTLVEDSED